MASKQVLVAVVAAAALAVAFLPGLAVATEYVVGDDKGWTLDFNYTAWTETKQFVVGDTLGNGIPPLIHSVHAARLIAPFSMRRKANFVLTILIAVFEYNSGAHNVVEVGGPDFLSCTKPANAVVWNSGEDRVTLDKAGRRWFFCAVGQHCQNGMKLKITVLETAAPTPQPAPAPFA
uniref:Blue copper protein n=1 Tax=Aegilops tauschii TaxID=37682 RepID=M8BVP8_AEGTA